MLACTCVGFIYEAKSLQGDAKQHIKASINNKKQRSCTHNLYISGIMIICKYDIAYSPTSNACKENHTIQGHLCQVPVDNKRMEYAEIFFFFFILWYVKFVDGMIIMINIYTAIAWVNIMGCQ